MKARAQVEGGLLPVFSSILLFLAFLAEKTLEVFIVVFKWRRDETYGVKCGVSLSSKDYLQTSNQQVVCPSMVAEQICRAIPFSCVETLLFFYGFVVVFLSPFFYKFLRILTTLFL